MTTTETAPVPAAVVRLAASTVLLWVVLAVWAYRLTLAGDVRGLIVPVVQLTAGFVAFGLRTEPTLGRWRTVLTVHAAVLALLGAVSSVSLVTVWIVG